MIIPSIDIMNGKVVQLRRGRELVFSDDRPPEELAARFGRYGPVAVVDLDAAMGKGHNQDLINRCCKVASCRVGGGIRTADDVRHWIKQGASKVVIGTMATPAFCRRFPRDWLVVALDARADRVVTDGWTVSTQRHVPDQARRMEPYCSEFLFTQVERDGTLAGCAFEAAVRLRQVTTNPLTVAGGVSTLEEIHRLVERGFSVQIGRALYEKRINLTQAWVSQVRFADNGLVPTIVQDRIAGDVLMLAYSNAESLRKTLETGEGWYYSRSRRRLWRKGDTSGHYQKLVAARWDCDRDAILLVVDQTGPACHLGRATCFGLSRANVLCKLDELIVRRLDDPTQTGYTRTLLQNPAKMDAKLREEIEELIEARTTDEIAWEAADVLYHMMVSLGAGGVPWNRVLAELRSRFKPP